MNLVLAQPYWLLLLPLALLAWYWAMRGSGQTSAGPVLLHPDATLMPAVASAGQRLPAVLLAITVALLVLALARPQWLGNWITPPTEGRQVVLLVDASPSMRVRDFTLDGETVSRMEAMKRAIRDFVTRRSSDHFSLVIITDRATTLVPMTPDRQVILQSLEQVTAGMGGTATALGDGLALAIRQIGTSPSRDARPLLLVWSDGDDTGGVMTPEEALALARDERIALYTIDLVGDNRGSDQPGLDILAQMTDGMAFLANDPQVLSGIGEVIDRRERNAPTQPERRQRHELYHWPAGLAALTLAMASFWRQWRSGES
ncbi:MAG: vWA domain-containing protein [Halothiobacillaceae bacterium]